MTRKIYFGFAAVIVLFVIALTWGHQPRLATTRSTLAPAGSAVATVPPDSKVVTPSVPLPLPVFTPGNQLTGQLMLPTSPGTGAAKTGTPGGGGLTSANAVAASPSTQEAMIDLDKTRRMIRDYRTLMGENPVGTNAEIMQAVMGGNPRQATLGPGEGQQLNGKGELLDRWGTPYFFHQLSGDHMEIHSAGPDRIMGTDDDLVLK